jgi:hypothetical protein
METVCAALLASYFSNVDFGAVDRSKLYAVPASMVAQMSLAKRATAKACALHYGVRYVVVDDKVIPVRQ